MIFLYKNLAPVFDINLGGDQNLIIWFYTNIVRTKQQPSLPEQ